MNAFKIIFRSQKKILKNMFRECSSLFDVFPRLG